MANNKIQYTLGFDVDSSKAKAQLIDLQNALNNLTSVSTLKKLPITDEIHDAAVEAKELQAMLKKATDVDTGKLNLSTLSDQLAKSNKTLKDYSQSFAKLGPEGKNAFSQITQSIAQAEAPLKKTNKLLDDMMVSLKNTVKWQLSSSAIHAFMGAIQGAYGYAQDLNKSLTDIRIVTERSSDQMAVFAKRANESAKALSTSTTKYTEAALIYYQQGLTDEEVKQRTDTTIKMANVTGENAANVSSYMTAIWNNYAKGSQNLEYFGDVITALGAATAASSEEIAGGLEKFAAIGETVGLSYEYATSALTTIIDKTRQSEDVVGTALKTIFARIQGLQQGETQEDGVTLNKYSKALENVGISIIDTNGELKAMDDILDEMGSKWETLSKAQQVALAQTVGGTRQYAQLIALMDNWDAMQQNLGTAYNSSGSLQKQADIYAESWEAAQMRVTAALQEIYNQLLNDKFFIGLANTFASLVEMVSNFIDTIGGVPGVLGLVGVSFFTIFKKQIPTMFADLTKSIQFTTGVATKDAQNLRKEAIDNEFSALTVDEYTEEGQALNTLNETYSKRLQILEESTNLTEEQTEALIRLFNIEREYGKIPVETGRRLDQASTKNLKQDLKEKISMSKVAAGESAISSATTTTDFLLTLDDRINNKNKIHKKDLIEQYKIPEECIDSVDEYIKKKKEEVKILKELNEQVEAVNELREKTNELLNEGGDPETINKTLAGVKPTGNETVDTELNFAKINEQATEFDKTIIKSAQSLGAFAFGVSALGSIVNTVQNDSLSPFEKSISVVSSLAMAIPSLASGYKGLSAAVSVLFGKNQALLASKVAQLFLTKEEIKALGTEITLKGVLNAVTAKVIASENAGTIAKFAATVAQKMLNGSIAEGLLLLAPWVLGIAAVVTGLTLLFLHLTKDKRALEAANKELENSQKAAQEASSAYNDLKSSIDSLKSAQDTLAGLTEGTLEWKEAVLKVNEQVLALIEKYPELAQYMTSDNGVLGISEEGLNKVVDTQLKEAKALQETVLSDTRNVKEQELKNNAPKWNSIGYKEVTGYEYKVDPRTHDTYVEEIGEDKTITANQQAEIIGKALKNGAIQNGVIDWSKMEEYSNATDQFKDAIDKVVPSLLELYNGAQQAGEQLKVLDKNKAETWIGNHAKVDSELAGPIAEIMAETINSVDFQETKTNIENQVKNASKAEVIKGYAQTILGEDAEESELNEYIKQLNQDIKDKKLDVNTLREYLANNAINYAAFNEAIKDPNAIVEKANEKKELTDEEFNAKVSQTASNLKVDEDALESYISYLQDANTELKNNREAALAAAEANLKFAKGAEKVSKAFSDNKDALDAKNEETWEYHEAIAAVHEATIEMLGIEVDTTYVKDHLDDIKKAAEGDTKALTKLQKTAAVNWGENFAKGVQSVEEVVDETGKVITEGFDAESWRTDFLNVIDDVANNLGGLDTSFTLNADTQPALDELVTLTNEALRAGQMTQGEMEAMFASMGYSPEVTWTTVPAPDTHTVTTGEIKWRGISLGEIYSDLTNKNEVAVPQIGDKDKNGVSFTKIGGSTKSKASAGKKAPSSKGGSNNSKKEAERYHEIKNVVEDINKELDALGKAKDRAFGKDKLALIDQEIAKLEDMKAAQSQYLKEIEKFYAQDKKAVAKYGAEFDEAGRIINYDEYMKKHGANEAAVEALEQYEETYDLLKDKQQEIIDIQNQIYDAALEKTKYKVDLQINVNDDDLKYLNYLLEKLDDAAYDAAESIANLGQQAASQMRNIDAYRQGINDIFAEHGLGDDTISQFLNGSLTPEDLADMEFTEEEVNTLREYRDGLLETNQALAEIRDNVWNEVMEALEALGEEFDKQSDKIDHLSGVLESYQNIIGIVGQEVLGITDEMMESFSDIAVDNAIDALTVSKGKLDALKERKAELEAALAEPGISESKRKELEKILDETNEMLKDAENDMLSDWEAALQAANDAFEQTTTRAIDNFKNAMAGAFGDMDTLLDDFAKTKEIDEMYLDDYKQIYELSKLTRDITKSIDDTDNIASKAALRDIQKEINDLQAAGVELSQYDLDYLRAKYELRLAEIALEDAQNAKNQVRMTRDSEGNWSYTYTADQDNIDNAQQNYEDKLYAIQELSTNYIKDLESQIVELSTSLAEEIAGIDRSVYPSEEAYLAEVERITNFYNEKMAIFADQMNNALANNNEIYTQDWTNYSTATGYKISADEDFLTSFDETTLGIKTGFDNMQLYQIAFNQAIGTPDEEGTLLGQLSSAYEAWKKRVDEAMDAAGTSTDDFKDVVVDTAEKIDEETDNAAESVEDLKDTMKKEFKEALDAAKEFEREYGKQIDEVIAANDALIESLNDVISIWSGIEQAADDATRAAQNYNRYASNPSPVGGGGNNNSGGTNNNTTTNNNSGKKWYVTSKTGAVTPDGRISPGFANEDGAKEWWKNNKRNADWRGWSGIGFVQMKTGGYTGDWGNSGKLAVLHQKELVLNADDTQNMLKSIEMVRAIARTIDLNNGMTLGWGGLSSSGVGGGKSEIVQEITINAEFPYATERNEIEAAFDSLFIRASQYANRK